MTGDDLVLAVRARLSALADPERAEGQQAYMKSALPFHGVPNAGVASVCKALFADYRFDSAEAWRDDVRRLWHAATHREERYAALELSGHRRARPLQGLRASARRGEPEPPDARHRVDAALALYAELVTTGAWWDLVDVLAAHRLGPLLREHHARVAAEMRRWSASDDVWLRRAAIICQIGSGPETDTVLLLDAVTPALDSKVFWLRKAIGWALRQYARHDPEWVRATVVELGDRLSPLSRREALKHLGRDAD